MNVINIIGMEKDENYILEADRLRIYYNINKIEDITFGLDVLKLSDGFLYKHDANIAISYGLKPLPYTLDILAKHVLQHPAVRTKKPFSFSKKFLVLIKKHALRRVFFI